MSVLLFCICDDVDSLLCLELLVYDGDDGSTDPSAIIKCNMNIMYLCSILKIYNK